MNDIKLEEWQALTIQSLAGERIRVEQRAQETINGINTVLERYAKEWGDGDGPFEFSRRAGEWYLVPAIERKAASDD